MNDRVQILTDNFLSVNEIIDIKNKIFSLKSYWHEDKKFEREVKKYFLFPGVTQSRFYKIDYYQNNKIMFENFETYYKKIKEHINKFFKLETVYLNNISLPGFHIFGPGNSTKIKKHSNINFHKDRFPPFKVPNIDKIYSFIIPIQLPKEQNAGLLYIENNNQKEIIYQEGCFGIWPGNVLHSIKPFSLFDEDDYRITWQIHASVLKEKIILFW